jgi:hypothetical protein
MPTLTLRSLTMLAGLALAAAPAAAIEFTSSLDSIKIAGRPGETVRRHFQLRLSDHDARVHFRSRVEDWWQSEDGSQSFYRPAGSLPRSCGSWIGLNPVEAAVEPGGMLDVRVTAAIPSDIRPGGYWCVLTVDQKPDPLADDRGVAIRFLSSISVGIFVTIEPVRRAAEIRGVEIGGGKVRLQVRNEGDVPLGVEGRVEFLRPGSSLPVATAPVPRATVLTGPVPTRLLAARLPDAAALPPGRYLVRVLLDIGVDHYLGVQREMELSDDLWQSRAKP